MSLTAPSFLSRGHPYYSWLTGHPLTSQYKSKDQERQECKKDHATYDGGAQGSVPEMLYELLRFIISKVHVPVAIEFL